MDKQKLIEIAKNGPFWPKACGQKALPDKSVLKGQKLVEIVNMSKLFKIEF